MLTDRGRAELTARGLDIAALETSRRRLCRPCLDWSARKTHLAGSLGAALLRHILDRGWADRIEGTREIHTLMQAAYALGMRKAKPMRCELPAYDPEQWEAEA